MIAYLEKFCSWVGGGNFTHGEILVEGSLHTLRNFGGRGHCTHGGILVEGSLRTWEGLNDRTDMKNKLADVRCSIQMPN